MAFLIVHFGRGLGEPPIMDGHPRRSESLTIAAEATDPVVTTLQAMGPENIVDLYAQADCWFEIGDDPDATNDSPGTSSFMAEGERLQFHVEVGDKVSVIAA